MKELTNAFQPYDTPGDVLENITNMKMGNNTIEDHTAQFRTLLEKLGVLKDSPSAIDYYQKNPKCSTTEENIGTTSYTKNVG